MSSSVLQQYCDVTQSMAFKSNSIYNSTSSQYVQTTQKLKLNKLKCFHCYGNRNVVTYNQTDKKIQFDKNINNESLEFCNHCGGTNYITDTHPLAMLFNQVFQRKIIGKAVNNICQENNNLNNVKSGKHQLTKSQQLSSSLVCSQLLSQKSYNQRQSSVCIWNDHLQVQTIQQQQEFIDQRRIICDFCNKQCGINYKYYCQVCQCFYVCSQCTQNKSKKNQIQHQHPLILNQNLVRRENQQFFLSKLRMTNSKKVSQCEGEEGMEEVKVEEFRQMCQQMIERRIAITSKTSGSRNNQNGCNNSKNNNEFHQTTKRNNFISSNHIQQISKNQTQKSPSSIFLSQNSFSLIDNQIIKNLQQKQQLKKSKNQQFNQFRQQQSSPQSPHYSRILDNIGIQIRQSYDFICDGESRDMFGGGVLCDSMGSSIDVGNFNIREEFTHTNNESEFCPGSATKRIDMKNHGGFLLQSGQQIIDNQNRESFGMAFTNCDTAYCNNCNGQLGDFYCVCRTCQQDQSLSSQPTMQTSIKLQQQTIFFPVDKINDNFKKQYKICHSCHDKGVYEHPVGHKLQLFLGNLLGRKSLFYSQSIDGIMGGGGDNYSEEGQGQKCENDRCYDNNQIYRDSDILIESGQQPTRSKTKLQSRYSQVATYNFEQVEQEEQQQSENIFDEFLQKQQPNSYLNRQAATSAKKSFGKTFKRYESFGDSENEKFQFNGNRSSDLKQYFQNSKSSFNTNTLKGSFDDGIKFDQQSKVDVEFSLNSSMEFNKKQVDENNRQYFKNASLEQSEQYIDQDEQQQQQIFSPKPMIQLKQKRSSLYEVNNSIENLNSLNKYKQMNIIDKNLVSKNLNFSNNNYSNSIRTSKSNIEGFDNKNKQTFTLFNKNPQKRFPDIKRNSEQSKHITWQFDHLLQEQLLSPLKTPPSPKSQQLIQHQQQSELPDPAPLIKKRSSSNRLKSSKSYSIPFTNNQQEQNSRIVQLIVLKNKQQEQIEGDQFAEENLIDGNRNGSENQVKKNNGEQRNNQVKVISPSLKKIDHTNYNQPQTTRQKNLIQQKPSQQFIFYQYSCDICHCQPIKNIRYHCSQCDNWDLCGSCYDSYRGDVKNDHRNDNRINSNKKWPHIHSLNKFQQINGLQRLKQRKQKMLLKNRDINKLSILFSKSNNYSSMSSQSITQTSIILKKSQKSISTLNKSIQILNKNMVYMSKSMKMDVKNDRNTTNIDYQQYQYESQYNNSSSNNCRYEERNSRCDSGTQIQGYI